VPTATPAAYGSYDEDRATAALEALVPDYADYGAGAEDDTAAVDYDAGPEDELVTVDAEVVSIAPVKPVYDASQFDIAQMTVRTESIVGTATLAPTKAPTAAPSPDGCVMVEQEEEVAITNAPMSFPLSEEEAFDPVVQQALVQGFSTSIGVDPTDMSIASVGAIVLLRRLQHAGDAPAGDAPAPSVEIIFQIKSPRDVSTVAAIKDIITTAAIEGSIVANIQQAASNAGVLTPAMSIMAREQPAPPVSDYSKMETTMVAVAADESTDSALVSAVAVADVDTAGSTVDTVVDDDDDFLGMLLGDAPRTKEQDEIIEELQSLGYENGGLSSGQMGVEVTIHVDDHGE
jgi:hypothetical protein